MNSGRGSCPGFVGAEGYALVFQKGFEQLVLCMERICPTCKGKHLLPLVFPYEGNGMSAVLRQFPGYDVSKFTGVYRNAVARFIKENEPKK